MNSKIKKNSFKIYQLRKDSENT